jgi:hypothetical protein
LRSSVLSQVGRWCRDQIVGPQLPTYDRACEELGGVPWRPKPEATDRWFIVEPPTRTRLATPPPIPSAALKMAPLPFADSAAFVLKKSLSEGTKLTLLGGGALAVIVICVLSLLGGTTAPVQAAIISGAPTAAAPILLAAVTSAPAPFASSIAAKSSAPHALAAVRAHAAPSKRHVAARHRRR